MAQCRTSPHEFIRDAFTPQVTVICTPEAQRACEKNNLDFSELLQPFSKLVNDVTFRDPSGTTNLIKGLKLTFVDINLRPPQTTLARKLLNSSVSEASEPRMKMHEAKNYQLHVPSSTPWYEKWRNTFMKVQYPSDHEFTKHYLGCLVVVSSNDINPTETMSKLIQNIDRLQSSSVAENLPKWFSSSTLKYYIILHDNVEGNIQRATEAFETLKSTYGAPNCFFLRINSRPPGVDSDEHLPDPWSRFLHDKIDPRDYQSATSSPSDSQRRNSLEFIQEAIDSRQLNYHPLSPEVEDVMGSLEKENELAKKKDTKTWSHGSCLSVDDVEQIKALVFEFTKSCLLPYIEKQLVALNEAVANKKGVSKSLFSATKRWFGTSKPNSNMTAVNNLVYSIDSPELHIRRLGDLYFMFGNYSAAFQAYHAAKRDYNVDQAWLYYAGALEMAALSAFMANEQSRKTYDYMEDSIITYLNTCKMPQFATRATLLSSECLKSKMLYGETAHQLIRMTSEDSDLRSALLLEQASYCFMQSNMLRKYAFHMVLSGHRFFKAAQKQHALRCYKQAYQIYEDVGWVLASDHIHYTIGRLANNLRQFDEAVESFAKLLTGESKQSASQQATFLKEFLSILESKLKVDSSNEVPILPIPELNNASLKVLVGPTRPLSTPGKIPALGINFDSCDDPFSEQKSHKLEEMLVTEESGSAPLIFKPMVSLHTTASMGTNTPIAIINEPIQMSIQLSNTLQTALLLKDIYLVWSYESGEETITNLYLNPRVDNFIKTYVTKLVLIQGNAKQDLILSLTPLVTGEVTVSAICYTLAGSSNTTENVFVKGKKILNISNDPKIVKPVIVKVVPYAPCLQMFFSEMNSDFLAGELQRVSVDLQNIGSVPLKNIMFATSVPHLLSNCELKSNQVAYTINDGETTQIKEKLARKNHITSIPLQEGQLGSGQSVSFYIWIKAPYSRGPFSIDLLTYYENVDVRSVPRYRLIRHIWNLKIQDSISVEISTQNSYNSRVAEDLALALKTTNLNKIHNSMSTEITLLNIAFLSSNWILTQDIVTPKYIILNSQESAHILFKARRKVGEDNNKYSSISLSSEKMPMPHLTTAFQTFAKKNHIPLLNSFNLNVDYKKRDGTLVLEWRALICDASNKRMVYGHTCVPIEITREEEPLDKLISDSVIDLNSSVGNVEELSDNTQNQVTYNVLHPSIIRHNFRENKGCIVPVTLVLHSDVEDVVTVTINTLHSSSKTNTNKPPKANWFSVQASSNFCWLTNGKIIRTLEPLSTTRVQLSVILANPGTFDLGANLGIFCSRLGKDEFPVLQAYEVTSALVVLDTGS
ncbi:trafficking protein particle complex subunit 8 [Euwallacea similis]|uniref:trafficking protein particle complex subunit 8 n=1 Tax=Euwallacea similis TaxID=1736056 RepID=UPI00344C29E6